MKKFLAIILALLMILSFASLAACDKKEEETTPPVEENEKQTEETVEETEEEKLARLESSKPNEYVQEKLDAGMEVIIGLCFQGLTDEFTLIQKEYFDAGFAELGFTPVTSEFGSDTALMVQQIENFVTMKAALIIAFPPDADSAMDVSLRAMEAGTYMVFTGLQTDDAGYEVSGGSSIDWTDLGANMAKMGLAWVDKTYPDAADGSVKVALGRFSYFSQSLILFDALEATLEADPRITIAYNEDMVITVDQGFTAAENALTYDPEIRMFFCFQESGAQGMNQFILSQNVDRSQYAVFTQGTAANSAEIVEQSKTDESVYRGTIVYGGDENPAAPTFRVACDLLFGEAEPPHWDILQQYSINGFDFTL